MTTWIKNVLVILSFMLVAPEILAVSSQDRLDVIEKQEKEMIHRSIRSAQVKVQISTLNKLLDNEYRGFDQMFKKLKKLKARK